MTAKSRAEYFREYEKKSKRKEYKAVYRATNRESQREHEKAHDLKRGGWKARGREETRQVRIHLDRDSRPEIIEKQIEYLKEQLR